MLISGNVKASNCENPTFQFLIFMEGVFLPIIGSEIEQEACSYKHWACFHALLAYVQVNLE